MTRDEKEKSEKKTPAPYQIYDKAFHDIFEEFREDIGVETKKDYQLDEKWTYKRPDTIIILDEAFDYSTLQDKVFPCLREWNIIEFKSYKDELKIDDINKYIANTNLLSCQMFKDNKDRTLMEVKEHVRLILVSSNKVTDNIMSDFRAWEYRKGFYLLDYHNYFPVYLIVIDDLEMIRCNYTLLLLGNEEKQTGFWKYLVQEIKRELKAKDSSNLWKYIIFALKREILKSKEVNTMEEIKELYEKNDCLDKLFDEKFLKKILEKRDDDFLIDLVTEKIQSNKDFKNKIKKCLKEKAK